MKVNPDIKINTQKTRLNLGNYPGIVGLGKTGESIKKLFSLLNISHATFDLHNKAADYNDPEIFLNSNSLTCLIVSPGVPLDTKWIKNFSGNVYTELQLAFSFLESESIVGVTGSVGKSTTVSLIDFALSDTKISYFAGGNLGIPLSSYVCDIISGKPRAEWIILELSSYQLEKPEGLYFNLSAITALTANHLDRYVSLTQYYNTKWNIIRCTQGICFLGSFGGDLKCFSAPLIVSNIKNHSLEIKYTSNFGDSPLKFNLQNSKILGEHNSANLVLAAHILKAMGLPFKTIERLTEFTGLRHRTEWVGQLNGVHIVNDSKATTIDSVNQAIECCAPLCKNGKMYILVGGRDKGLPWHNLKAPHNSEFIFFGECAVLAKTKSNIHGPVFLTLGEAVIESQKLAKPGDCILLSPGGTSLDEFKNFEERGNFYRKALGF